MTTLERKILLHRYIYIYKPTHYVIVETFPTLFRTSNFKNSYNNNNKLEIITD